MKQKNSGKIYRFSLDFDLGYGFSELLDFSDISDFSGRLLYIFRVIEKDNSPNIEDIKSSGILFGPVPLSNYPNVRGKGAWKLIGEINNYSISVPILKNVQGNYTQKDWSKIDTWYKLYNFEDRSSYCSYEEVRRLELPVLYRMKDIQTRATMQLLIEAGKKVNEYYDLNVSTPFLRQYFLESFHY